MIRAGVRAGHAAQVAGNAALVAHVLAELRQRDVPALPQAGAEAFELARQWLGGDDISPDRMSAAATAAHDSGTALSSTGAPEARAVAWACTAIGNLCWMACRERGWTDASRTILDAASYALTSGVPTARAPLEALRERATAAAQGSPKNLRPPLSRPRGLEHLGSIVTARMSRLGARVDPRLAGDPAALRAALAERLRPVYDAVLAFDARYGGIVMAEAPGREGCDWIFGGYACLTRGIGGGEASGLVPIAASPNDNVYFLDEHGAAWGQDTLEDPEPVLCAPSGTAALARIVLFTIVFQRRNARQVLDLPGLHGDRIARQLGLPLIEPASDPSWRAWADRRRLVIEQHLAGKPFTIVAGPAATRFAPAS